MSPRCRAAQPARSRAPSAWRQPQGNSFTTFGWPTGEGAVEHVVHAHDLGLQVPLGIAADLLLLRRRAGGDLVAAIMLVNAVCMGAALTAMVAWAAAASGASVLIAGPFAFVWGSAVILAAAFFRAGAEARHSGAKLKPRRNEALEGHP